MKWHKVHKYIPMESPVIAKKRGENNGPRIFNVEELDGFYVHPKLNRTVHITFEEEDVIVVDVYDTVQAAYKPVGEVIGIVEINLSSGKAEFFKENR